MIDWRGMNAALRDVTRKFIADEARRILTAPEPWFIRSWREAKERDQVFAETQRWADDGGRI